MKYILLLIVLVVSEPAISKKSESLQIINAWLTNPSERENSDVVEVVNGLEKMEIIHLIKASNNYSFVKQFFLLGLIANYNGFDSVFTDCLDNATEREKAICIAAFREWKGQRGAALTKEQQDVALNLLRTGSEITKKLIVLTVISSDNFNEDAFSVVMDIIGSDLSYHAKGLEVKNSFLLFMDVLTDTDISRLREKERPKHYDKWLENNKHRLKPSTLIRKNRSIYTNYLHRFIVDIPMSYQRIYDPKFIAGKRCFFGDPYGRSITVETYPKSDGIGAAFQRVRANSKVKKYKEVSIGKYRAIKYTVGVEKGILIGLLIELEERIILSSAYTPVKEDTIRVVEELISGISVL